MAEKVVFDRDKFKRLFHYIVWRTNDPAKLGATKLNKILWFSDARAHIMYGKAITGETYIRREHGPVAKHYWDVCKELEVANLITHWKAGLYSHFQDVFRTNIAPDMTGFTDDEMQIVDHFWRDITEHHTATSISEKSHDYGWEIAKMGEPLPYHAILAERGREPRGDELEWAKEVVKRRKLP